MNTKERNIMLNLLSLAKNINMDNKDIKYNVADILIQTKIGLSEELKHLNYRKEEIERDLKLIKEIANELDIDSIMLKN